eukprot:364732-Chlamydomonas_euryale.AAC.4
MKRSFLTLGPDSSACTDAAVGCGEEGMEKSFLTLGPDSSACTDAAVCVRGSAEGARDAVYVWGER